MRLSAVLSVLILTAGAAFAAAPPDLVVVISVDQFPSGFVERFAPWFGDGGFNRFLKTGANFPDSRLPYAATFTAPGHAAIATGMTPSQSGIVSNEWYDRGLSDAEYCVGDDRARPSLGTSEGISPVNLAADSLGDRVKEKYPGSKVVGIALKDRSAVLMAGRKADAAYWFDEQIPGFTSSTYYRANSAAFAFNASIAETVRLHKMWTQSSIIPAADLARVTFDPPELRKHKSDRHGLGTSFPHPVNDVEAFTCTPFANDLILDFARRVIELEQLGTADGSPDVLFISLSPMDYLGHLFGPDSLETADMVVRTDRAIASFLNSIEQGRTITVALTSDHGVQSIPEIARARGEDAGRIDFYSAPSTAKSMHALSPERLLIEKRAAKKLRVRFDADAPPGRGLVLNFEAPALHINWARVRELELDGDAVRKAVRDAALGIPGVAKAITNSDLLMTNPNPGRLEREMRESFRADRSGDVIVALKPGYIWGKPGGTGTTHGQPVDADQRVPVMLWGHGVRPGSYRGNAAPTDLARSLGALLGVEAGGRNTIVLPCMEK